MQCNPGLTGLLREAIGDAFLDDAEALTALDAFADDSAFQAQFKAVKLANKTALSNVLRERMGHKIDPSAMFDVQSKRIHEYKRQLLNIIEVVALYDRNSLPSRTRLAASDQAVQRQGGAELSTTPSSSSS